VADYYYLDGARNQQGPVPPDEIARLARAGTIRRDTMVWSAGMSEWGAAGQVSELAPLFAQAAPPPRPAGPPPAGPPMQRPMPAGGGYQGQPRPGPGPQYHAEAKHMGFMDAVKTVFSKYATFKGRARRPEYWWFYLFYFVVLVVLEIIDAVIANAGGPPLLSTIAVLAFFLPTIAVATRRLHDTDRSGWMQLIALIPIIGIIILIVFLCQRGTDGPNRFGPDDAGMAAEFD
jgi:uncharacterized membrane protein YhaH (DUF805 family)